MSDSPFHGIFSAFSASQAEKVATSKKQPKKKAVSNTDASDDTTPRTQSSRQQGGQIAVDIFEHDGYFVVRAPIAGVKLNDLDIEVDGKTLTISGKRQESDEIDQEEYFLKECFWGHFSRSISLPIVIDPKKVKATFSKDGILKVYVPKAEEKVKIVRVGEG